MKKQLQEYWFPIKVNNLELFSVIIKNTLQPYNFLKMNCIKMFFFCAAVIAYNTSNAQDRNSFLIKLDSIEIDIYNNVDFDIPNEIGVDIPPLKIDLNNLPEPTIYIIDGKATNYGKYSDFSPTIDKIDSIEIIKNPAELKNRGFDKYKSAVIITTKKE